jgi:hypothetical protein
MLAKECNNAPWSKPTCAVTSTVKRCSLEASGLLSEHLVARAKKMSLAFPQVAPTSGEEKAVTYKSRGVRSRSWSSQIITTCRGPRKWIAVQKVADTAAQTAVSAGKKEPAPSKYPRYCSHHRYPEATRRELTGFVNRIYLLATRAKCWYQQTGSLVPQQIIETCLRLQASGSATPLDHGASRFGRTETAFAG